MERIRSSGTVSIRSGSRVEHCRQSPLLHQFHEDEVICHYWHRSHDIRHPPQSRQLSVSSFILCTLYVSDHERSVMMRVLCLQFLQIFHRHLDKLRSSDDIHDEHLCVSLRAGGSEEREREREREREIVMFQIIVKWIFFPATAANVFGYNYPGESKRSTGTKRE